MDWIRKNKKTPSENLPVLGFAENKIISQGRKAKASKAVLFLMLSFLIFVGFSFESQAAISCGMQSSNCTNKSTPGYDPALSECGLKTGMCMTPAAALAEATTPASASATGVPPAINTVQKVALDILTEPLVNAFKWVLVQVFNLCLLLTGIATTLFAWVINPDNMSGKNGLLNKQAVKDVWIMVRDLLNMTFILILLFAAFCTIFQVEKWNLKKVWLNVLINALMVNFSFPIARFFIDISNVAFYYFVNNLFTSSTSVSGSSIMASLTSITKISSIFQPANYASYDIAYLVAMIVFTFILGMTMLIIAALFVVRLVALAMLVMFSPIGFVGYVFPATASYANDWWQKLFSYAFFAPVMMFMMAISMRIMEVMGAENFQSFISNATVNAPSEQSNWIAQSAFFTIPIITLWMGIGIAQKAGVAGAATIVGSVTKGGKWLANRPGALGGYAWKKTGIPGGVKKGMEDAKKSGKLFGSSTLGWLAKDGTAGREAGIASVMGKKKGDGIRDAYKKAGTKSHNTELDEDVKKAIERHDAETTTALKNDLTVGSVLHGQAMNQANRDKGVEYMAKYKQLMSDPIRKQEHEADVRQAALLTAALDPAVAAAHIAGDDVAKTAAIEAHVQQQIASSYGTMKTNFQAVRNAHKKN